MRDELNALLCSDLPLVNDRNPLFGLIDSIPALVAYIDCDMILQYCNQSFKEWFCVNDDAPGKSFPLVAGKQVFDQLQRHMGKVLTGERANFQISVYTDSGLQYLDATLSPNFDNHKQVKGFIFHSSDVTEKNRTERALKDYFENAAIGLHWVNAEGIIIWANPAELQMLGYQAEEYIGHHISEFHVHKHIIQDILDRLSNKQKLQNYEADMLCKDGSIKHVSINSTVLWEGDKFIHTRCFTIDITEQKVAAKALAESEERFRMMANLVPLVIWTTDSQGNCIFLSVRWEELTGKSVKDGLGNQWLNFVHPDDRGNIVDSWQKSVSHKKPFEGKFRINTAKGEYHVIYANSLPRYGAAGEFEGYIGIIQDISSEEHIRTSLERIVLDKTDDIRKRNAELKLAEMALVRKNEELQKINNQLSSFAHIASHDLQEPLRKIQTFSSRLFELEGGKFSTKGKELYQRIHDSSQRMKNLIQDLLTYSKSNDNEGKFEFVDLNLLLAEVIGELELKIAEKKALIENSGLPCVKVIRFQFHQLFLNLLSNALKFSRAGIDPVIKISSEIVDDMKVPDGKGEIESSYHHISIVDNGIGFDQNSSQKIFEMFQRLHGRTQYEGTGIGLAICKKIVENHQGVIVAEGQLNIGAVFHIYLPVAREVESKE